MADTSVPKAMEGLAISKTKELKGTEKRDTLVEIEKVGLDGLFGAISGADFAVE